MIFPPSRLVGYGLVSWRLYNSIWTLQETQLESQASTETNPIGRQAVPPPSSYASVEQYVVLIPKVVRSNPWHRRRGSWVEPLERDGSYGWWYGCFLEWWHPQNTPKWSFLVGKPMVVGYHHFRKPPYEIWPNCWILTRVVLYVPRCSMAMGIFTEPFRLCSFGHYEA